MGPKLWEGHGLCRILSRRPRCHWEGRGPGDQSTHCTRSRARPLCALLGDDLMALACIADVLGYFNEDIKDALAIPCPLDLRKSQLVLGMALERVCLPEPRAGSPRLRSSILKMSLRLSPLGPQWPQTTGIGIGHMFCGEARRASRVLLQVALQENPSYPLANRFLASCYVHLLAENGMLRDRWWPGCERLLRRSFQQK